VAAALPEGAALAAGGTAAIEIQETFSHAMHPYPEEISQVARHSVLYEAALHVASPYPVASEETTVVFADPPPAEETEKAKAYASPLLSASPRAGAVAGKGSIKWGPFSDLGAWAPGRSEETLQVRWIRDKPLVYSDRVVREVTVYPWSGVSERLDFRVSNGGAKITGSFSRFHHLQGGFVKAINDFNVVLPREATDLYYRDEIGNISTSKVTRDAAVPSQNILPQGFGVLEGTVLNAVPRYPLLGGWKATFELGYTVPWKSQVQRLSNGRHRLTTLYGSPLFPATVGELELRIVLPEGARNPQVRLPHGLTGVEVSEDTKVTWFDVHGRPVVVLRGKDLIEDHRIPLTVDFEYSMLWMLKEPLMFLAALAAIFLVGRLASADLVLVKDESWRQRQAAKKASRVLSDFAVTVAKRDKAFKALEGALQRLLDAGDFTAAERARKRESDALSGLTEQLESTAGRVGPEASARGVDALLALEQQKEELCLSLFDRKVEFVRAKTDPQKIEKELGADSRRLRDLQRQSAAGLVKLAE
jgi:oligosaccharyltransferase complex subunit alpha (ribophorin I)